MVGFEHPAVRDWDFPRSIAGVALLVEHARARGLTDDVVLGGSGLDAAIVGRAVDGAQHVTAAQELRVVRNLRARLGEVGAEVGRRYRAATFGILGYALLSSPTVLDAMNVALRFLDLSHAFTIPSAELDGDQVRIVVDGSGLPDDVCRFLVERDAAAIRAVLAEIVPGGPPTRLRLDEGTAVITLPAVELARPLPRSDPALLAVSVQVCHDVVEPRRRRTGVAGRTRVVITQQLAAGAPMAAVGAALGMSERTLRRRLTGEATTYQRLLDEVRCSLAEELLATGRLSVGDVAVRLGYAESSSFILAFKRWTGRTPGAAASSRLR